MAKGLCARCKRNPVYVTAGGNASGYCWDCRKWHQQTLQRIKKAYPYEKTLAAQGFACALCREPIGEDETFHYDHDHETGAFRGLICHLCNLGLGGFRDNPRILFAAMIYLEGHNNARNRSA